MDQSVTFRKRVYRFWVRVEMSGYKGPIRPELTSLGLQVSRVSLILWVLVFQFSAKRGNQTSRLMLGLLSHVKYVQYKRNIHTKASPPLVFLPNYIEMQKSAHLEKFLPKLFC